MAKKDADDAKASNDAYTGMLSISLLALIVGCVLLYLDYSQYPDANPPKISLAPAAQTAPLQPLQPPAQPPPQPPAQQPPPPQENPPANPPPPQQQQNPPP